MPPNWHLLCFFSPYSHVHAARVAVHCPRVEVKRHLKGRAALSTIRPWADCTLNERAATATLDEKPPDVENTAPPAPSPTIRPVDEPDEIDQPLTPPASHYLLLEENMNIHEAITDLTQLTYVLQYISEHGPTIIHNFNDVPEKIIEQAERIGILETPNDDETIQRLQQLRDMGVRIDFLEWMS